MADASTRPAEHESEALPLLEGERAPTINTFDHTGQPFSSQADWLAGKPLVLLFCDPATDTAGFPERLQELIGLEAAAYIVAPVSPEACAALHRSMGAPVAVLADPAGAIATALGLDRSSQGPALIVLDPAHRLARRYAEAGATPVTLTEQALRWVHRLHPSMPPARLQAHPPVLVVPRVLDDDECRLLVDYWHKPVTIHAIKGRATPATVVRQGEYKIRHDSKVYGRSIEYQISDATLERYLDARFQRRLIPELRKAFQTNVSRREGYKICGYDSAQGGMLLPHRDNPTPETAHRRFTVTVNLNAGEYEGGELRFREYGEQLYAVERGTAVLWSAALLHEVLPLTAGRRFVLGAHLYGK